MWVEGNGGRVLGDCIAVLLVEPSRCDTWQRIRLARGGARSEVKVAWKGRRRRPGVVHHNNETRGPEEGEVKHWRIMRVRKKRRRAQVTSEGTVGGLWIQTA